MARLAAKAYYHGTFMRAAADALDAGDVLKPCRPSGTSRFTRSREGLVYLTPSFNQAAEYAFMRGRSDWGVVPGGLCTDVARVFEFEQAEADVVPEEDELGYAVKVALCREAGIDTHWSMNSDFAQAIRDDMSLLGELADIARSKLTDAANRKRLGTFRDWKGADVTAVGRKLSGGLPADVEQALVDAGISVATASSLCPVASYRLPVRVTAAEDAELVWRNDARSTGLSPR